jgi:arabinogalactan endo-1,4-beta-galactosidase
MLHYDNGGDTEAVRTFYQRFNRYRLPYDMIGFSYYPWWHGNLIELRDNLLSTLANFPDKDVMLVEVGYRPRVYAEQKRLPPYPEEAGRDARKDFLEAVTQTVLSIPNRKLKGIFWWEPATRCNSDFFDEQCNARPVMRVFDRYKRR